MTALAHLARRQVAALTGMAILASLLTIVMLVRPAPAHAATQGGPITWSEVKARAEYWLDPAHRPSHYDSSGAYQYPGPDGIMHRTDCSGYVSMALDLPKRSDGTDLASGDMANSPLFTPLSSAGQLQPGDIIAVPVNGSSGHVVLFGGWADSAHNSYIGYEFGGDPAPIMRTISPYPYDDGRDFRPYHYNNLVSGSGTPGLPLVAFAGRNDTLYLNSSAGLQDTAQGMAAGTSPSVTTLASGGHEIAFESNTNHVAICGSAGNHVFSMAMKPGTSPAIARYGTGTNYLLAYQNTAGSLEYYNSTTGDRVNTGLGMRAGTSPSIATNGSNYQIAINANVGILYAWTNGKPASLGYSIHADTNPAVTAVTGGFEIAFQSAGGDLWVDGTLGTGDRGLALAAGSSPAIVNQGDGYLIAAPAADGTIQMVPRTGGWTRTNVAFRADTSPAIAHYDGSYEIAVQHRTGILVLDGRSGYKSTGQHMDLTSSPATS